MSMDGMAISCPLIRSWGYYYYLSSPPQILFARRRRSSGRTCNFSFLLWMRPGRMSYDEADGGGRPSREQLTKTMWIGNNNLDFPSDYFAHSLWYAAWWGAGDVPDPHFTTVITGQAAAAAAAVVSHMFLSLCFIATSSTRLMPMIPNRITT